MYMVSVQKDHTLVALVAETHVQSSGGTHSSASFVDIPQKVPSRCLCPSWGLAATSAASAHN